MGTEEGQQNVAAPREVQEDAVDEEAAADPSAGPAGVADDPDRSWACSPVDMKRDGVVQSCRRIDVVSWVQLASSAPCARKRVADACVPSSGSAPNSRPPRVLLAQASLCRAAEAVAPLWLGKVGVVHSGSEDSELMAFFELTPQQLPTWRVLDLSHERPLKFQPPPEYARWSEPNLLAFVGPCADREAGGGLRGSGAKREAQRARLRDFRCQIAAACAVPRASRAGPHAAGVCAPPCCWERRSPSIAPIGRPRVVGRGGPVLQVCASARAYGGGRPGRPGGARGGQHV